MIRATFVVIPLSALALLLTLSGCRASARDPFPPEEPPAEPDVARAGIADATLMRAEDTPAARLWIASGNGQVVPLNEALSRPLRVQLANADGEPLRGVAVEFREQDPGGALALPVAPVYTDAEGQAEISGIGANLAPDASAARAQIEATATVSGLRRTVVFAVTVVPPNAFPRVRVLGFPDSVLHAHPGERLEAAIRIRLRYASGGEKGHGAGGVGVTVDAEAPASEIPTAQCEAGMMMTDPEGFATCDLLVGSQTGEFPLTLTIGGVTSITGYFLSVQ